MTQAQRRHAREQRALLALRRAAVRWVIATDAVHAGVQYQSSRQFACTELDRACDAYHNALSSRERIKLVRAR